MVYEKVPSCDLVVPTKIKDLHGVLSELIVLASGVHLESWVENIYFIGIPGV